LGGYLRRLCLIPTLSNDIELGRNFRHCCSIEQRRSKSRMDKIRRNLCAQTLDYRVLLPWTLSSGERNSIPPLFRCSTHHRVIDLQKVISDCFMVTQDNRAPIVGPHSITPWMMLTSFRMSKESFFRTLNIEKRRSIQFEDADNQVSDPTDLGEKLDYNLFNIITDIVRKCWRAEI